MTSKERRKRRTEQTAESAANALDPPVWTVRVEAEGREQLFPKLSFMQAMTAFVPMLGTCLNRETEKFAFEIYRDGELRAKFETFPKEEGNTR